MHSTPFFCPQDPMSPSFRTQINFGGTKADSFSAFVLVTTGGVQMTKLKIFFYDHRWKALQTRVLDPGLNVRGWGLADFMTREKLKPTEKLGLRVVVEVEYEAVAAASAPSTPLTSRLSEDILRKLDDDDDKDVTFLVQGEKIKAHKFVLSARSSYFQAMFKSGLKESVSNQVTISDVAPKVFRELLRFLYSGSAPEFQEDVTAELLAVADKYGLEDLKKMCASFLASNLRRNNVVDIVLLAHDHGCPALQDKASAVLRSNLSFFAGTYRLRKLESRPALLTKLLTYGYKKI